MRAEKLEAERRTAIARKGAREKWKLYYKAHPEALKAKNARRKRAA